MTCSGTWDGDCVSSKAVLLICCWPQSQALCSTSPGWCLKRGIWDLRGRHHATYRRWAEPYQGSWRAARDQSAEVWRRIWDGVLKGPSHELHLKWKATSLVCSPQDTIAGKSRPGWIQNTKTLDNLQDYRNTHGSINHSECLLTETSDVLCLPVILLNTFDCNPGGSRSHQSLICISTPLK